MKPKPITLLRKLPTALIGADRWYEKGHTFTPKKIKQISRKRYLVNFTDSVAWRLCVGSDFVFNDSKWLFE